MSAVSDEATPPKWLGKRRRSSRSPAQEDELISATVRRWTVSSAVVERGEHWKSTKVRVSKLHYSEDGVSQGRVVAVLEGPNSDRTLQDFADHQNATGATLKEHKKAFADFSEAARQKSMVRHNDLAHTQKGRERGPDNTED